MYSWQKTQWQQIAQRASMPHALLFRGRAGIGKHEFTIELSQALLCAAPKTNKTACGACQNCVWFAEDGHPDFKLISPEDIETNDEAATNTAKKKSGKKNQISVAQIRQLNDYLSLSSHQVNSRRVILISPAESLNTASANALLKVLEEPPTNTLFLLVTSQPHHLLATIRSRCQAIDMSMPTKAESLSWLQQQGVSNAENALNLAGGAPLLALQLAGDSDVITTLTKHLSQGAQLDAFACAPLLNGLGMGRAINTLQKWVFDLAACKLAEHMHYHLSHSAALHALCKSVNLHLLLRFQQQLLEAKKLVNHPLNNELQLEIILLQYTQLFKPVKLK